MQTFLSFLPMVFAFVLGIAIYDVLRSFNWIKLFRSIFRRNKYAYKWQLTDLEEQITEMQEYMDIQFPLLHEKIEQKDEKLQELANKIIFLETVHKRQGELLMQLNTDVHSLRILMEVNGLQNELNKTTKPRKK